MQFPSSLHYQTEFGNEGQSVDLIYLDPPLNSKRDYNLLSKSQKAAAAKGISTRLFEALLCLPTRSIP